MKHFTKQQHNAECTFTQLDTTHMICNLNHSHRTSQQYFKVLSISAFSKYITIVMSIILGINSWIRKVWLVEFLEEKQWKFKRFSINGSCFSLSFLSIGKQTLVQNGHQFFYFDVWCLENPFISNAQRHFHISLIWCHILYLKMNFFELWKLLRMNLRCLGYFDASL